MELETALYGFEDYRLLEHITLHNPDLKAVNSAGGEKVKPAVSGTAKLDGRCLKALLPPASWNVIRMGKRRVLD
jgi:alpha-N-arabinofuranosidase